MITTKGVAVPDDMAGVLQSDADVLEAFESLRPGDQRVYVNWVSTAGGTDERSSRLAGLGEHVRSYQRRPAEEHGDPHPLADA